MAASFTTRAPGEGVNPWKVPGSYFDAIVEVTAGTADYAAGGYAFGATQLNTLTGGAFSLLESVEVVNHWRTAAGGGTTCFVAVWDSVNGKVQAYGMAAAAGVSTGLTEVANATANLNGLRCSLRVRAH